ncbi:MAG: RluA family pseudouridine synthase [Bacteriovoracaceae bacterium]|jgi:tRNA pseudouridine32 synthase / 23S rRNA pseudouridine746 synthase|nr:RluA family pseudouridine synthase [Bacteriovoracaceae bacterium]
MENEIQKAQIIKLTVKPADNGRLIVDVLAENSGLSKSLIKKLMMFGAVFQTYKNVRKRVRKAKMTLRGGDQLECYFDPKIDLNQSYEFKALHQTKHYGVYHKPAGAMSEGSNYGDGVSLLRFVEKNKRFAHMVNRLDKEVEGLVVIAYDSKTQNLLQSMWRQDVTKKYQAIVLGEIEGSAEFNLPINDKFSLTRYQCVKTHFGESYMDLSLATERKNQVRIHFSHAGYPVIGDPKYGENNKNREGLQLVSYLLEFVDPYTKQTVEVLLPKDRLLFEF